jgi:hypothetical protein
MDYSLISKRTAAADVIVKKPKTSSNTSSNQSVTTNNKNKYWISDDSHYNEILINVDQIEETIRQNQEQHNINLHVEFVYDYLLHISKQSILPLFDKLNAKELYHFMYSTTEDDDVLVDIDTETVD